jgi:hypothetical protein
MVATKKTPTRKPEKTVSESSSLKLKKVKKTKKPSVAAASIIDVGEGSSSVVVADDIPKVKKPKVEINIQGLEEKERLETQEIQALTVTQLKKLCKSRKIGGYSGKRKDQIVNLLIAVV